MGKSFEVGIFDDCNLFSNWNFSSNESLRKSYSLTACCQTSSRDVYRIHHDMPGRTISRGQLVRQSEGKSRVTLFSEPSVEDKALILVGSVIAVSVAIAVAIQPKKINYYKIIFSKYKQFFKVWSTYAKRLIPSTQHVSEFPHNLTQLSWLVGS